MVRHARRRYFLTFLATLAFSAGGGGAAHANPQSFEAWVADVKAQAISDGVRPATVNAAFAKVAYLDRVIELDRKQPEGTITFEQYKRNILAQSRIDMGRKMFREHRTLLNKVSAEYGVPPQVIVALWGIETNYGRLTGGFHVIDALSTLAYDGRRPEFFRKELIESLHILDQGHITPDKMTGSWAGAMGQCQFMPSSFKRFAQDYDRNGHINIWSSLPDVFASTANYLNQVGWNENTRWGRQVKLSPSFDMSKMDPKTPRSVTTWGTLGVRAINGDKLPLSDIPARLIQPDGKGGKAYLVYPNFDVIMDWNKSTYFATTVGLLSDLIAQQQ